MKEYCWEPREEFFPEDEGFQEWWNIMDFEGAPFEGCDCAKFEEHYQIGGGYAQNLDVVTRYNGIMSGEEIAHYRCPYCDRDFYVYTSGDFKGYEALEEDL